MVSCLFVFLLIDPYQPVVGGNIKERFDPILNGFSASIADATFQSFQSLQGSVIKYIGE